MDNFVFKLNWNIKVSIVSKFDRYINGFSEISKFRRYEWKCLMYVCEVHWTFVMLRCYAHDDCQLNQSYRSIDSISCCRFDWKFQSIQFREAIFPSVSFELCKRSNKNQFLTKKKRFSNWQSSLTDTRMWMNFLLLSKSIDPYWFNWIDNNWKLVALHVDFYSKITLKQISHTHAKHL